jgi:predicted phage-related endonuclease
MNVLAPDTFEPAPRVAPVGGGHVRIHPDMIQGSDEWLAARCGLLTASEMKLVVTPTLKAASNDKERAHLYELAAQRITRYVEPQYVSDDMLRGQNDEYEARDLYAKHYAPVTEVGFITNNRWGFTLGYSPDALVGEDGAIECKSRRQKYQFQTIAEREVPADFVIQLQTGLLVSERKWIDFVSYCGGLPMIVIRVFPDPTIQAAILDAAAAFEERLSKRVAEYQATLASSTRLIPTERRIEQEMFV